MDAFHALQVTTAAPAGQMDITPSKPSSQSRRRVPTGNSFRQGGALLKIPSLVFDIEMEDEPGSYRPDRSPQAAGLAEDLKIVRNFLQPSSPAEVQLVRDVEDAKDEQGSDKLDASALAQSLISKGYNATLRKSLGGGPGSECMKNLYHSFVIAIPPGQSWRFKIIVDPQFKEQFVIAKSTERYTTFVDALPDCLVMSEDSIGQLVTFLCTEMNSAFMAHGSVLPPWRQTESMLSKWQPRNSIDESFRGSSAGGAAEEGPQRRPEGDRSSGNRAGASQPGKVFKGGNFQPVPAVN